MGDSEPGARAPLVNETDAPQAVYARREPVVLREIAGERLLIPIRRQVGEMKAIYALAGTGGPIFELLDGERSLGQIRDALVGRFEVSHEQAWADLCEFVKRLEEGGLVERRG